MSSSKPWERLAKLTNQITPPTVVNGLEQKALDVETLISLRETKEYRAHKWACYEELKKDVYKIDYGWNKHEYRAASLRNLKEFVKTGLVSVNMLRDDPARFLAVMHATGLHDFTLGAAIAIHFELFGMSVMKLGTERHHKEYLPLVDSVAIKGCFGMTEIAHGSNVRGIRTTATFDEKTDEFVIHTPDDSARKFWIGMSFLGGNIVCVVFARLVIKGKDMGVHAFITPLRKNGQTCAGVTLLDCGDKIGWQGVDNSCIHFNQVRIPRTNMLDRYGQVARDGSYKSPISDEGKRFAATLAALVFGRLLYCAGPAAAVHLGLQVSMRYALQRKQFGPADGEEVPIMAYPAHQRKLLPALAQVYALEITNSYLTDYYAKNGATPQFHSDVSAVKAWAAEWSTNTLSLLRVTCGGHGYAAYNRIGQYRVDYDNFQTAEGDCTVLRQQTARYLLAQAQEFAKTGKLTGFLQLAQEALVSGGKAAPALTPEQLLVPTTLSQFFAQRFARQLQLCAKEAMAAQKAAKAEPKQAFAITNATVPSLLQLVDSYTFMLVLHLFNQAVAQMQTSPTQAALAKLSALFALQQVETDPAFLSLGVVSPATHRVAGRLVGTLSGELTPYTLSFVQSFDIPDFILRAPLGLSNLDYVKNTMAILKPYPAEN